jgi:predicted outer membrane repeat protein
MSNGTISGNTARENGGGVYVSVNLTFTKTGGTITGYASDQRNGNAVKNSSGAVQNYKGHAVYAGDSSTLLKIKDGTAGPGDNMAYNGTRNPPTASGAWDN